MIARRALPRALLLHGAGGGGWQWDVWRAVFTAAGVDVRAPSLQPAPGGPEHTTLDDYRAQALAAARALGPSPLLVGASLGGLLALATAAELRCTAVVLVNPLPPAPEAALLPGPPRPARIPWRSRGRFAATVAAMPEADAAARIHAWRRWRDESGAAVNAAHAGLRLPDPKCPLLVIASRDDRSVPPVASRALAQRLGGSLLHVDGGHLAPLHGRAAAEVARLAIRWMNCAL
jgi:pimeloyl-ACP methyl ester carboxylesterase